MSGSVSVKLTASKLLSSGNLSVGIWCGAAGAATMFAALILPSLSKCRWKDPLLMAS